jgi:hypothetical protein
MRSRLVGAALADGASKPRVTAARSSVRATRGAASRRCGCALDLAECGAHGARTWSRCQFLGRFSGGVAVSRGARYPAQRAVW